MGNVEGSFAFLVSCGEGLVIEANRLNAHHGKSMCVCLSFRCKPMMWQSSMLISLLVFSPANLEFGLEWRAVGVVALGGKLPWFLFILAPLKKVDNG